MSTYNTKMYDDIIYTFINIQETSYESIIPYNIEQWINPTDVTDVMDIKEVSDNDKCDEDIYDYNILFDLSSKIINEIPNDFHVDCGVKTFIENFTSITSEIITYTVSNKVSWNVDLRNKFIWIALMIATKTSDKAIHYIGKLVDNNDEILTYKNRAGNNCFTYACWNMTSLNELIKLFGPSYLRSMVSNNLTIFDLLIYTGSIIQLIENKIIDIDELISYENPYYKMNTVHFSGMAIDNTVVLEYLITSKKITKDHMYLLDINGNFPLLMSCILGSYKSIKLMLDTNLYGQDILTLNNLDEHNILYYANRSILMKYLITFVDEENFFKYKFYDIINTDEIFQLFIHSKLFTYDVMVKPYNTITQMSINNLFKSILFNVNYFVYLNETNDDNINNVMKQIFDNQKQIMAMSFTINIKISMLIIKSKYMNSDLLEEIYNGSSFIDRLANSIDTGTNIEEINKIKQLTEMLVISPYLTKDMIKSDFIIFCAKNFCYVINKLIEREFIRSIVIIYYLVNTGNIQALNNFFNDVVFDLNQLNNHYDLLGKLIKLDKRLLYKLLSSEETRVTIINILTNNYVIDIASVITEYHIDDNIWSLLVKSLSVYKLNSCNLINRPESIIENIQNFNQLKILVDSRPDFDHTLFFKRLSCFFISKCLVNDIKIIKYLMSHTLFTKQVYDNLITLPDIESIMTYTNKDVVKEIIHHKYFSEKLLNIKFFNKNNLLQHLIVEKMDADVISYIINHKNMTQEIFDYRNNDDNNCLMLGLYVGSYVSIIINSKYFRPDMMITKNRLNISADDIIYDYINSDFLTMYFKLFPTSELINRRYADDNTIIHKLVSKSNLDILVKLISILGINILLIPNNIDNTALHLLTQSNELYDKLENIFTMERFCLEMKKEYFYIPNKLNETPLMNIIIHSNKDNINIFRKLIKLKVIEQIDLDKMILTSLGENMMKNMIILKILDEEKFDIPLILKQRDNAGKIFFSKLINNDCHDCTFNKYITKDILESKDYDGNIFLFDIMTKNYTIMADLIKRGIINIDLLSGYLKKIFQYPSIIKSLILLMPDLFTKENILNNITKDINIETFELLIEFNTFNELYNRKDLIDLLLNSDSYLKYIFDNNLVDHEIIRYNDYQIIKKLDNPLYIKDIFNIILQLDDKYLILDQQKNKTIFHKCAIYPNLITQCLKKYILIHEDYTILLTKDNLNKTFLDYLIENEYIDDIDFIIQLFDDKLLLSLIENQDYQKRNFVMKCCISNKSKSLLQKIKLNMIQHVLFHEDYTNTTTLMYIIRYTDDLLMELISLLDLSVIYNRNVEDDDIFTIATRYNYKNLGILINDKRVMEKYNDYNKCFVIACRYESNSIKLLLETDKINLRKCNGILQYNNYNCYANFLQIACRYNESSVRELINIKQNLENYFTDIYIDNDNNILFNALKLALIYEPNTFELILNSKYGNIKLLNDMSEICEENNCIIEIINKQMASYLKLTNSKYFNESLYNHPKYGNLLDKFDDMLTITRMDEKILKYKDIACDEYYSNICSICYSNEERIIFVPCSHKSCITCASRLGTCPQCRSIIEQKLLFNKNT